MPAKGRKPSSNSRYGAGAKKPSPSKQTRVDWIEVPDVPYEGPIPNLPKRHPAWPPRAKAKWKVWSRMPHCVLWTEADWDFAIDALEVAARFYEGHPPSAVELRNREKQLGTTIDYRRDLRIRYIDPNQQKTEMGANVPNIDDYRSRIG